MKTQEESVLNEINNYTQAIDDVTNLIENAQDKNSVECRMAQTRKKFYTQELGFLNEELTQLRSAPCIM